MTVNELYKWLSNPSTLTKASLPEIQQLIEEYPYFQVARMLYLKNLFIVEDVRFQKELKKMSVYVSDRRRLYMLIESGKFDDQEYLREKMGEQQEYVIAKKGAVQVIPDKEKTETITEQKTEKEQQIKNQYITIPPADYISWLESNADDIEPQEDQDKRLKHQELIDLFIESDGKLQINRQGNEDKKPENGKEERVNPLNTPFEKNLLDDSYFTETLAHVYFTQKRYDKALEIIRVLNLKYPEKNIYFADQIRYLEKIINLKK
jgi:hypothetical protein